MEVPSGLQIIDLSHWNTKFDAVKVAAVGIVGVILKATQGKGSLDSTFTARRQQARDAGLLFGAYHFGVNDDGFEQAEHFLDSVRPVDDELLVLDYEPHGPSQMTLKQAEDFSSCIPAAWGYWSSLVMRVPLDSILRKRRRWVAKYGAEPAEQWDLWQYTDGSQGPYAGHPVDGVGLCDRSVFRGTLDELKAIWRSNNG